MGTPNGSVSSPTAMFQSSNTFFIDESKLCFNKTHFNRSDFNVERFMNLARQKADLKTIQQDLRLYLKSVQNSMIELINDDYADFVHLSSNLVSLQESLNKINQDIDNIWEEFEESTKDSVGTAEKIEKKCEELGLNRERQSELRDRIAFLSAIEKLASMLKFPPQICSVLWLQKITSLVVELKSTKLLHSEEEKHAHQLVLSRLEEVLCKEGVRSASTDCATLPLVLSILSIIDCSHSLTAKIVSDLLYAKFVKPNDNQYEKLTDVFKNVVEMRKKWSEMLGKSYSGKIQIFLDETLLTFVLTFIDKCMGTVAVPSDTHLFHRCFTATQDFINEWPSAKHCRETLKAIRDKFNLLVYFKLETHKFSRNIENAIVPDNFELCEEGTSDDFYCKPTLVIYEAIEHVWNDEVYIPSIVDKLWDFTLRQILRHSAWCQAIQTYLKDEKKENDWNKLLLIRTDASKFSSQIFDFALESIWTKLRDLDIDTSQFGQCLTKYDRNVAVICQNIDNDIVGLFTNVVNNELAQVSDVPKQYRWTKKAPPTVHSSYVKTAFDLIENFKSQLEDKEHPSVDDITKQVCLVALKFFAGKAKEVQDSVEATGSSLSRFKRKNTPEDGAVSDDDKIKIQIHHDAAYLLEKSREMDITVEGLDVAVERFHETIVKITEQSNESSA